MNPGKQGKTMEKNMHSEIQLWHIQDFAMNDWLNQAYIRVKQVNDTQLTEIWDDESGLWLLGNVVHVDMAMD